VRIRITRSLQPEEWRNKGLEVPEEDVQEQKNGVSQKSSHLAPPEKRPSKKGRDQDGKRERLKAGKVAHAG